MRFLNTDKSGRIRIGTSEECTWVGLKKGQEIDLPEKVGKELGLKRVDDVTDEELPSVTEGTIGDTKVETKQFIPPPLSKEEIKEKSNFRFELNNIKGIGLKTALDIIKIFPTRGKLKFAISHDDELPFRDDVEIKLRKKYGGLK